jgi:hypothetical protein
METLYIGATPTITAGLRAFLNAQEDVSALVDLDESSESGIVPS